MVSSFHFVTELTIVISPIAFSTTPALAQILAILLLPNWRTLRCAGVLKKVVGDVNFSYSFDLLGNFSAKSI